jgi:hypothetical protein
MTMLDIQRDSPTQSDLSCSHNTYLPNDIQNNQKHQPSLAQSTQPMQLPPPTYLHLTPQQNNNIYIQGATLYNEGQEYQQFKHHPTNTIPPFTTNFHQLS